MPTLAFPRRGRRRRTRCAPAPMANLTRALATRPRLHTLATMLPERVERGDAAREREPGARAYRARGRRQRGPGAGARGRRGLGRARSMLRLSLRLLLRACMVVASSARGLFFAQAKKHSRLCELIRAGDVRHLFSFICVVLWERMLMRFVLFVQVHHAHGARRLWHRRVERSGRTPTRARRVPSLWLMCPRKNARRPHLSTILPWGLEASMPSTSSRPRSLTHASPPRSSHRVLVALKSSRAGYIPSFFLPTGHHNYNHDDTIISVPYTHPSWYITSRTAPRMHLFKKFNRTSPHVPCII